MMGFGFSFFPFYLIRLVAWFSGAGGELWKSWEVGKRLFSKTGFLRFYFYFSFFQGNVWWRSEDQVSDPGWPLARQDHYPLLYFTGLVRFSCGRRTVLADLGSGY